MVKVVKRQVEEVPTVTFMGDVNMVVQLKKRVLPADIGVLGYETENISPPKAKIGHCPEIQGRLSGATERDQYEKEARDELTVLSLPRLPLPTREQAAAMADSIEMAAVLRFHATLALRGIDAEVDKSARHLDSKKALFGMAQFIEL